MSNNTDTVSIEYLNIVTPVTLYAFQSDEPIETTETYDWTREQDALAVIIIASSVVVVIIVLVVIVVLIVK